MMTRFAAPAAPSSSPGRMPTLSAASRLGTFGSFGNGWARVVARGWGQLLWNARKLLITHAHCEVLLIGLLTLVAFDGVCRVQWDKVAVCVHHLNASPIRRAFEVESDVE
jgi:hypothetical protein